MQTGHSTVKTLALASLFAITATLAANGSTKQNAKPAKDKVRVEFYVMSQCPFGTQVEDGIAPVLKKMGASVEFSLDFIGEFKDGKLSSMHGSGEVVGDMVQLCAAKHMPDKYMDMILCMNKTPRAIPENWKACAKESDLDLSKITTCLEGPEGRELLGASFEKSSQRRALGSPTMFIGGKPYSGSRSIMAFTRAICDAFDNDKPKLCSEIPPPVKFAVTIITDKRCEDCNAQLWKQRLQGMFPGAEISIFDYSESAGRKLYDELRIKLLPAIIFDRKIEKTDNFQRISRFLAPKGPYLALAIGSRFDPSREICDNHKDDTGNGLTDCNDPDCKGTLTCRKEVPKKLEVFVMSQCPYGVMALNTMKEVLDKFGTQIDFEVHYIASKVSDGQFDSMHGQGEVDEDIRELCAMKHYPENYKWMDYVLCRNKNIHSPLWESCTGKNGIAKGLIKKCFEGQEGKKLLAEEILISKGLGIEASPTWLSNNKFKFSGIDAETVRKNICQHNKNMANCDKALSGPPLPKAEADCGGD